jgi:HEAT repeat protein
MKTILLAGLLLCLTVPMTLKADEAEEARLIAVIQSGASSKEKEDACWRLKQIGTAKSVPALASLLTDEHLYQAACDALVTLPVAEAGEALRAALKTASGNAKAAVIHALGERRHRAAVADLAGWLRDADPLLATSAARALGEIGGSEAIGALREVMKLASVRAAAVDALLRCASQLAAEGDRAAAAKLFQEFDNAQEPEHIRAAAYAGLIRASGDGALALVLFGIADTDSARQIIALQLARGIQNPKATAAFTDLLSKSSPATQSALLALLQQRGDASAAPAVVALASSADSYVRLSAISALGVLGDATAVPLLATAATSRDEAEQKVARQALISLRRGDVGRAMVAQLAVANPDVQAELARALAARAEKSAVPPLLELARGDSEAIRKAAVRALSLLADGSHLAALVKLMAAATTETARDDVRGVFESIVDRAEGRKSFDVAPLISGLNSGTRETRIALLQVGALFADERLRTAFRAALKDSDAQVRGGAARSMCATRDAGLLPDLLELARTSTELNLRVLALEGYVRLVREDASGFNAARRAELLQPAYELAARPEEKRLVLSALTAAPHRGSLQLAERALSDSAVKTEAEIACVQIAKALGASDPDAAEASLQRLVTEGSPSVRTNAQAILRQLDSGWLCAGPYRQEGKSAQDLFDTAFAPEQAVASEIKWRRAPGSPDLARAGEVVLDGIVSGDHCVVYLKTLVFVPAAQTVNLEIGSDDGIKLWVNGELVHANNAVRGLTPGQDRVKAILREGWNEFKAKITQHTLGCGMTLRVVTEDGKAVPGLRFDPRGDSK